MKTFTKPLFKVLSIVLTILLLAQVFPISTFAEEASEDPIPAEDDAEQPVVGGLNQIGQDAAEEPTVLGELEDLRDERVKRFRLSDGTVAAARYAMPVHTMVGGRWQTLDNTLSLVTDETDTAVYTTALRSVVYPQKLGGNSETAIEAKAGEYAVALRPDMPGKKAASAKVVDTKSTSDDPYAVHNLLNHVEYAFSNTLTLAYDYSPACLKESIILNKKPDSAVFSFSMNFGGLVPVLETDGSVTLYTDSTKTVAQAVLMAPFMEDAEGAVSREIQVALEKSGDDYRYTLTASGDWLNAFERAYPVVIDPTLWLDIARTDLVDCYVDNSQPSTSFPYDYYLYAGMNSLGKTRTYMKVANLPALPVGSVICDAQYYLWQKDADLGAGTQTNYITAHEVTSSWSYTTLTWNNQPSYNSKVIDYCAITTGSLHEYRFDITRLAKSWYEGDANYGIMLKTRDESLTKRARFYSTSTSATDAFPHILVTYRSNKGLESYWSTTDFSAGSAGTAHVHDYSGALTFELPVAASSGEIAPVSMVGYFNSYEANVKYPGNTGTGNDVNNIKTSIGRGFRLNVQQTVIASAKYGLTGDAASDYPYVYTDGDGTEHYIVKQTEGSTTTYVDEDGLGLTLILGSGNTSYVLKDDKNNQLQFNSQGNLCKTVDSNGNAVTINFLPANTANGILAGQRISSVTDGSGHTFAFTYHHNADGTESGYVTKITVAGAETQFSFSGGLLQNVSYANGMTTVLRYDNAQLSEVQDTNQYLLHFFYTTGTPWPQISMVKGKQYGDTYYSKATGFDRTDYNVLVVRTVGKNSTYNDTDDILTTYQFDNYGKAVTVQARTAGGTNYGAAVCNYTPNRTSNVSDCRTSNRVAASASLGKNVVNLLRNGNAESTTNWSNYLRDGVTASLGTAHYMGQKSLQFTCSQATTSSLGYWYQDYTGMAVGSTYTFSAYVKTANMSPVSTKGAYVAVKAWGGTEEPTYSSHFLTDNGNTGINNGWRRLTASITVPEGTTKLRVYAGFAACNGTVNFDCLQLENASVAGSFNLLENPSFERYTGTAPESWSAYNHTACVVTSQHKEGAASVQTTGDPAQGRTYYQSVPVDGNRDETYIVSGWAKANAILPDAHSSAVPRFNISIRVTYLDSSGATCTEDKTPASFNPTVTGWQYTAQAFTLAHSGTSSASYTPTHITVILRYDNECNTAWFDLVQLTRDVASSYVYNADGKLTTVKANAEQQSGLTYSNTTKDLTAFTDALGYTTNYTYDSAHNLTFTKSPNNVYTALQYNTNGNVNGRQIQKNTAGTEIVAREGIAYTEAAGTTPAYAYVRWFTTEDGGKTTYDYNTQTGFLNSSTASNGTVTAYTPQHATNDTRVKKVTTDGTSVNYSYTGSRLTGLTYGVGSTATDSYVFTYNKFGDPVSTKVGGVTLSTNSYVANSGLLEYTTYGNGTKLEYVYDYLGRVTGVKNRTGTADSYRYTWAYAPDDTVRQHRDGVNVKKYRYDYDSIGRLIRYDVFNNSTDAYIGSSQFGYDKRNNLTSITFAMDGKSCLQRYFYSPISGLSNTTGYAADNLPTRYQISSASHVDYSYDVIERLTQKSLTTGSASLNTDYTYKASARGGNYTTHLIETELLANDGYQYTYNLMGNITAVKKGTRANMSALSDYRAYTYDAKCELTGETIYSGGSSTTRTYTYDGLGNLTAQTQTGVLGNKSISYTYGTSSSAGWGKMLNSVSITQNGNTTTENIVYDAIGNPTTYRGASLTWFGRQLTNYSKSGTTVAYTYDADGLRGKKTVNGTTSTYQYVNGHLAYEKRGSVQYFYFYDSFGKLSSIRFYDPSVSNGSAQNYFTLTNQQGDIVAIYNVAGTKVASYEYDAWGNIISTTDTSGVNISTRNPFRYRGYYYDQETGLYYLQSRYYDPEIGRFINADKQLSTGDMTGMNLYAYCGNNPVNGIDPTGEAWWHWALGAAIVVACAAATVVTCGGFAAAATAVCMVGSGVAAATTASTVAAAAFIGSATVYGTAVAFAASTSNSVQEFNDQGNWGTVLSTAFGGLVCGCDGYTMSKPQTPTTTTTVYRSVSGAEAQDIKNTGRFNLAPGGMESKQFGFNLSETRQFGNMVGQNTIVSARVPNSMLNQLYTGGVDTSIFRAGTLTVYGDQLEAFNQAVGGTIRFMQ